MNYSMIDRASRAVAVLGLLFSVACGSDGNGVDSPPVADYEYAAPLEKADGWSVAAAADEGVDEAGLQAMVRAIQADVFADIDSIAVARNGRLLLEETLRTRTDDKDKAVGNKDPAMHAQFSVSKSITALLIGAAIEDGLIDSVNVPYLSLFPYSEYANWDARKNDMTLKHVLAMQTGLDWNEFEPPYTSPDNQLNRFVDEVVDWSKAFLDLPVAGAPGSLFAYVTPASTSLGQAIENVAPIPLIDYGLDRLILPLDINRVEVVTTPTGLPNGGSGFHLLTRDAAKLGQLVLDGGEWNGRRVVSADWIAEMTTPRTAVHWPDPENRAWQVDGYAYQWWTGSFDVDGEIYESIAAWGWAGQWIMAIPRLDLVVAINASGYDDASRSDNQALRLIRDYLIPAATAP